MPSLTTTLQARPYPGRGLIAARTLDNARCLLYFLTGRSPSSRQRRLATLDGGDIAVQGTEPGPFDPLRHYVASARRGPWVVVGNGAQVVPVADALAGGADALTTWSAHSYEPDGPIFTPRIWVATEARSAHCLIGYALRADRGDDAADRVVWLVDNLQPGHGVLLTTYDGTPEQVRNARVPVDVDSSAATSGELLDELFGALDADLRVAAFALDPDEPAAAVAKRP